MEEAFEAGAKSRFWHVFFWRISGTVYMVIPGLLCQDLLVELGVPAELIEEKLLVTQTGKRLLE